MQVGFAPCSLAAGLVGWSRSAATACVHSEAVLPSILRMQVGFAPCSLAAGLLTSPTNFYEWVSGPSMTYDVRGVSEPAEASLEPTSPLLTSPTNFYEWVSGPSMTYDVRGVSEPAEASLELLRAEEVTALAG